MMKMKTRAFLPDLTSLTKEMNTRIQMNLTEMRTCGCVFGFADAAVAVAAAVAAAAVRWSFE